MGKLKIGVFGAGRGMTMVRQLFKSEDAELVAVCDKYQPILDRCRREAEAAGMDKVRYFPDFDSFIESDMDAVIMANYANEHAPFAIRCLESGRHVMSEVLTCTTMDEAVRLIEAVERTGKIYSYAENYCYTPPRREMRRRYRNGDIGELIYAEGEYVHDCTSIWPQITYGERNHWRNDMHSTFYCTHSLGPILHMTGLRPIRVSGFQSPYTRPQAELGYKMPAAGLELVTLENGAFVKSLHGCAMKPNSDNYQINGEYGMFKQKGGNVLAYVEQQGQNCRGEWKEYTPEPEQVAAVGSGHGGGDFFTTYYFIRSILGDEYALENTINVYDAVDMCICGILAYKSIVDSNKSYDVPNLRNIAERDAYRGDTFCSFRNIGGNMYVPYEIGDKDIPDSVYEEVERRWRAGEPG